MMRIIAGRFKSRQIDVPPGDGTRPTLSRTRESLFSILFNFCIDQDVLDLFAGSGALGFEALSRGAKFCTFSDCSYSALTTLKKNVERLQVANETEVIKADWQETIRRLGQIERQYGLIFIDPPYAVSCQAVLESLVKFNLLADDGLIVYEHDKKTPPPQVSGLLKEESREYRDTVISFYRKD